MLLTGRFVTAAEAAAMGLINRAAPAADRDLVVEEAAAAIAAKAPRVVALGKETFQKQIEMSIEDAYVLAGERMVQNLDFPETKAGIDEFLRR